MSDMSQAQGGVSGGDPLDLVNATGTDDDVMPGPGNTDADDSGDDPSDGVSGRAMDMVNEDPAPEGGGATLDPPDSEPDHASGVDPLQDANAAGGDLESGADPMPDMSGTTPS